MVRTEPLCHVRVPPSRRSESLSMTLSYTASTCSVAGAVLASPLPFLGGDMDNNVVRTLADVIATRGLPVLRYDYRSVGASLDVVSGEARYETWRRVEESGDRSAVVTDAAEALGRASALFSPVLLGGYSFGCWTAAQTANIASTALPMVLVAPPLGHIDLDIIVTHQAPVLLAFAGSDALSPPPPVAALHSHFPRAEIVVLDDADHFFLEREADLAQVVGAFLDKIEIPHLTEETHR